MDANLIINLSANILVLNSLAIGYDTHLRAI